MQHGIATKRFLSLSFLISNPYQQWENCPRSLSPLIMSSLVYNCTSSQKRQIRFIQDKKFSSNSQQQKYIWLDRFIMWSMYDSVKCMQVQSCCKNLKLHRGEVFWDSELLTLQGDERCSFWHCNSNRKVPTSLWHLARMWPRGEMIWHCSCLLSQETNLCAHGKKYDLTTGRWYLQICETFDIWFLERVWLDHRR